MGFRASVVALALTLLGIASPAQAVATIDPATGPNFMMPFACGEAWKGTSRAWHSPSSLAIDWNAPDDEGHPVLAAASGTVTKVVFGTTSYGIYVVIDHGANTSTLYGHLQTMWLAVGQRVEQGQAIGLLGSTGNSTGPHLHFEERLGSTVVLTYFARTLWKMGSVATSTNCPDQPITGDWNGNGVTDLGVVRHKPDGVTVVQRFPRKIVTVPFGKHWDWIRTGDWDGDRRSDLALRPASTTTWSLRSPDGALKSMTYGAVQTIPLTGDWDGDGIWQVGVWRPDMARFALRAKSGTSRYISFGSVSSIPVTGDWDGNKATDVGVYNPANATFLLRAADGGVSTVQVGDLGSVPLTGDWNGDGITDVGVWNPANATFTLRWVPKGTQQVQTKQVVFGNSR
ncbi:MAG: M23 family metallopeptidase [Marmoricola sp.]